MTNQIDKIGRVTANEARCEAPTRTIFGREATFVIELLSQSEETESSF